MKETFRITDGAKASGKSELMAGVSAGNQEQNTVITRQELADNFNVSLETVKNFFESSLGNRLPYETRGSAHTMYYPEPDTVKDTFRRWLKGNNIRQGKTPLEVKEDNPDLLRMKYKAASKWRLIFSTHII